MSSSLFNWYPLLLSMKQQHRRGWTERGLGGDSIADHSFACIVIGWFLAQQERCDPLRVYELLIVHEIVMAKMPDVTPASGEYGSKEFLQEARDRVESICPG